MLEKEEIQKQRNEEKQLDLQIDKEKKKEECIEKAIRERELENQYNFKTKREKDRLDSIKQTARIQVEKKRSELKKKILKYRERSKQRMDSKISEIKNIRIEIADKLTKAYRKGDVDICKNALQNDLEWQAYCRSMFSKDNLEYKDCLNEDNKCNLCCDKEFGNVYIQEKELCIVNICEKKETLQRTRTLVEGKWVWNEISENKVKLD